MFDLIRKHTLIMAIILGVVSLSFVFFGMDSYSRMNEGASKVAKVAGHAITQTEWDNAHMMDIDRARTENPSLDLSVLDTPVMKYAALERLLRDRVLAAAAQKNHLMVSDSRLAAALQQDPSIAALRDAEGRLDVEGYKRLLATQGLTPEGFEERLRANMSIQQVLGGIVDSELISQAQVGASMDTFLEQREARVMHFRPADFAADLSPSPSDLEAFYQTHLASYQAPESADIEYIVLDLDSIKKNVAVSEQDLRTYYEQNAAALTAPEERRARHILIVAPADAPAAERDEARARANELLDQVRAAPDSFVDVAREHSEDDLSAPDGGDLGFFQASQGIDPSITEATFKLSKVGDISDLVESDFGFHIVQLAEIKADEAPSFEEMRAELDDQLRTQQAQRHFSEMADIFTNGVYEQSDSLQPVADELKLEIQRADGITRTPAADASGALASRKFLDALFSSDALDNKRNTEAVEVGTNQLASGRVLKHVAAHARPLADVEDDVRQRFLNTRGAELARQEGEAKLKAWRANPGSADGELPDASLLSREDLAGQPLDLVDAVLRADPAKLPSFVGIDLGADGYAVARIDTVLPPAERSAAELENDRMRYERLWLIAEVNSYYEYLKTRYKAKILVPKPVATAGLEIEP